MATPDRKGREVARDFAVINGPMIASAGKRSGAVESWPKQLRAFAILPDAEDAIRVPGCNSDIVVRVLEDRRISHSIKLMDGYPVAGPALDDTEQPSCLRA